MDKLLYGVAYYDEYMPYDRLDEDVKMMKAANINVVRIAESTWSTHEPQEGVFDFRHVTRVLDAMEEAGISVIVGTPTYAIPTWMVKAHPDILATTKQGPGIYGARQIMDITHPAYLFYAERIIRKLMEVTAHRKCVIGFQLDNETKYYDTAGCHVQERFVKYLREKFHDDLDAMNGAFGLDYWSNRINAWEDFPDVRGTINGSLGAEFEKFQRTLVDEFLMWQSGIVKEYAREDQFITHNFDFEWKGYSYGVQPMVDQVHAARALTVAGCDIYHPTQDYLTGTEIAFGGDLTRSLKKDNYFVLETEAQGFPQWTPYDGQLRLQAFSHLASGANMVEYWHWHSIHNAIESHWKGVLSHDFTPGAVYQEAKTIGGDLAHIGSRLVNLKRTSEVAVLVSNRGLTGLKWSDSFAGPGYGDILRWVYDSFFRMNVSVDIVDDRVRDFSQYDLVVTPGLYCAEDSLIRALREYVQNGGHLLSTFRSFFCDENVKIRTSRQPGGLSDVFGMTYDNFTVPVDAPGAREWMELLRPDEETETLLAYDHPVYADYAAATCHSYGSGSAAYIGTMLEESVLDKLLEPLLPKMGIKLPAQRWPIIIKEGENDFRKRIRYVMNYSAAQGSYTVPHEAVELITGKTYSAGEKVELPGWGVAVLEY